ncbi:MAG: alpha/beta hydrolase [Bacteroidetes bacterium MedPE-SWsnd-G2]|mgnify:CR=1 FL=1|nr:MAG: alpha/beta hydrolase [Bacteroidetes bacterium MedPE-SWsnd-G2]
MKSYITTFICYLVIICSGFAQNLKEDNIKLNDIVDGSLLQLEGTTPTKLVIIIAGSGPTDRDGNQNFMKNNSLKKLAIGLTNKTTATFRYDKRSVKLIKTNKTKEKILFDDFIEDAKTIVSHFITKMPFKKIIVVGHSQGSLIGMLASQSNVDGFISIAGPGRTIDKLIIDQVGIAAPDLKDQAIATFKHLETGETTTDYPPELASIFNAEVQPFIINWMQYNPAEELSKLQIPCLAINGSKDLQTNEEELNQLVSKSPNTEKLVITNMNHVFVTIEGGDLENSKSYNNTQLPISEDMLQIINEFISKI